MAAKATDEGIPIAAIRAYVTQHFPNAESVYHADAARWVIMGSKGKSFFRDVIGTGPSELKAWRSAYKEAQMAALVSTINTVPPEKIYDDPDKPPPGANVWSYAEKRWKPLVNGKEYPVIEHKLPGDGTVTMNPITGKANLDEAVEYTEKIKFSMSPGKIIPIDSAPKLNPILMMKPGTMTKLPLPEEDFPEYEHPKDNTKMNGQADLTNVVLNQQIVLAGLGNVILRQAYSQKGEHGRKIGIYCTKCRGEKTYYNELAFKLVKGKLHEELTEFCFAHRHDGMVPMPHMEPAPAVPAGFRKFREDD